MVFPAARTSSSVTVTSSASTFFSTSPAFAVDLSMAYSDTLVAMSSFEGKHPMFPDADGERGQAL